MKCGKCGYRTTHLIPTMCDGGQPTWGRTSIRDAELLAVDVDPCEKCDHMLCILARWILRFKGYVIEYNPTGSGEHRWRLP